MRRVRLILLILLVSICPVLWAGSHVWGVEIGHRGNPREYWVDLFRGSVYCTESEDSYPAEWYVHYDRASAGNTDFLDKYCIAGFGAKRYALDPASTQAVLALEKLGFIRIPFWFLSSLGFLLGWWLWRRGRRKTAAGFPVTRDNPVREQASKPQ